VAGAAALKSRIFVSRGNLPVPDYPEGVVAAERGGGGGGGGREGAGAN
jgi:hypothetical protein